MTQHAPPPNDVRAEIALISAWFWYETFRRSWKPEPALFYDVNFANAAVIMAENHGTERFRPLDLCREMTVRGLFGPGFTRDHLLADIDSAPVVSDPSRLIERLRDLASLRDIRAGLQRVLGEIDAESLGRTREELSEILRESRRLEGMRLETAPACMSAAYQASLEVHRAETEPESPGLTRRIPTGLQTLDGATGGMRSRFVWLLMADTSWGKSSFVCRLVHQNLMRGDWPLIVTAEDEKELYGARLLQIAASIHARRLRDGQLSREEHVRAVEAIARTPKRPVYLDAIGKPVQRIVPELMAVIAGEGIVVVHVDYLQALRSSANHKDRRAEVEYIDRALRDAIKQSGAAGLIGSQVTVEKGEKPTLKSCAESRAPVKASEVVIIGYEEKATKLLSVSKVKNGPRNIVLELSWNTERACFDFDEEM